MFGDRRNISTGVRPGGGAIAGLCAVVLVIVWLMSTGPATSGEFGHPPPDAGQIGRVMAVGITRYWIHETAAVARGVALRDTSGRALGPKVTPRSFCHGANEGTMRVKSATVTRTFNIEDMGLAPQTDCAPYFREILAARPGYIRIIRKMERTSFLRTAAPFGLGARGQWLVPYRSIAVDPRFVAANTLVFLPSVRGRRLRGADGGFFRHDGYFLAVDTGTDIKGARIDLFQGRDWPNAADTLDDLQDRAQPMWIIRNPALRRQLRRLHAPAS